MNTTLMRQRALVIMHFVGLGGGRTEVNSNLEIRIKKADVPEHGYYQQQYFSFSPMHV